MRSLLSFITLEVLVAIILCFVYMKAAYPHEIYSNLRNKNGMLCCGGNDCARTIYRENGRKFQFLTRKQEWLEIPNDRIQFLPVPGDQPIANEDHVAHLCYRDATEYDMNLPTGGNVFIGENGNRFYLYCAFIPPGSI